LTPGKFKVTIRELLDEKYENYHLSMETQTIEVKKDIAYEKIDVSNEVKTEAEINVAKEDTKKKETTVESSLQDTVSWIESTEVATTYIEVEKSTIPDPLTFVMEKTFLRMTAVSGGDVPQPNKAFTISATPNDAKIEIGKQMSVKLAASGYTEGASIRYTASSANGAIATVAVDGSGNLVITGVAPGTTTVTVGADYSTGTSAPSNSVVINVTVTDKKTLTLDHSALPVFISVPAEIKAVLSDDTGTVPLTVVSSNTNVATATVNGRSVIVNGVAAGTATITVSYVEGETKLDAVCTVEVKEHPQNDKKNLLKDRNGEQLYVLEGDKYREAVYADYYTATKFFIKGDAKYTGWQTIDGKVYYFDANGKKVTGEQVIQGAKYNFASDGTLVTGSGTMGIDVSKWNGNIDWNAVKNSGISYVIIRCGYRGSSQGMLVEDPKFATNIKGATGVGLKVGVYFFTQAVDEVEAVEEASYVLDKVKNYKISYPIFLDVEPSGGRGDKINKATRTAVCKAFCETIRRGGYTSGIYANKTWLNEKIDTASLAAYKIWLAQYAATPTYTGRYDMWQYKSTGKVSGISGDVDLNLSYLGY
jgi:GH25 family lysozyme M1 (1,4-beta-N-acetylmuramidase)